MKKQRIIRSILVSFLSVAAITAAVQLHGQENLQERAWKSIATRMPASWYGTDEAKTIAEQVLLYQRESGGWPKNLPMHRPMSDETKAALKLSAADGFEPTFDNDATITEMKFMARMYAATQDERYRRSFERGLDYIFAAQYPVGGWPQFYPLRGGYFDRITFNDDAMANILTVLKEIYSGDPL